MPHEIKSIYKHMTARGSEGASQIYDDASVIIWFNPRYTRLQGRRKYDSRTLWPEKNEKAE